MSASYKIDKKRRLVETIGSGVFVREDLVAHQERLLKDPDFDPEFSQILDFTQVTRLDITESDLRFAAERSVFSVNSRRALIVATDEAYGLARMFEIIRGLKGEEGINIFRTRDEALEWLFPSK